MDKISYKGVLIAVALGIVLDFVLGTVMLIAMLEPNITEGMTDQQLKDAIQEATMVMGTNPVYLAGGVIFSTFTTAIAGFTAVRIARRDPYLHGGIIGAIGILLGTIPGEDLPYWTNVVCMLAALPAALLGARLAGMRRMG